MSSQITGIINSINIGIGERPVPIDDGPVKKNIGLAGELQQAYNNGPIGLSSTQIAELSLFYGREDERRGQHYYLDYFGMNQSDIEELIKIKKEAEEEFNKTGKWNPVHIEKANIIRDKYNITKDVSLTELNRINSNLNHGLADTIDVVLHMETRIIDEILRLKEQELSLKARSLASGTPASKKSVDENLKEQLLIGNHYGIKNILDLDKAFFHEMKVAKERDIKKPDFTNKFDHMDQHKKAGTFDDSENVDQLKAPSILNKTAYDNLKLNGTVNQVTVKKNGRVIDVLYGHISKDGVTYIDNLDGTGIRLVGAGIALYKYSDININGLQGGWAQDYKNRYETTINLKPDDLRENMLPPEVIEYIKEPDKPKYDDLLNRPEAPIAKDLITSIQKPEISDYLNLPRRPRLEDLVKLPKEPILKKLLDIPSKPPMQPLLEYPSRPTIPSVPEYLPFDEPKPPFSLDTILAKRFKYYFGIDDIEIGYVEKDTNSCFISKEITIVSDKHKDYNHLNDLGASSTTSYIKLDAKYTNNSGSVEFFILDGDEVVDIIAEKDSRIINEKYIKETRFEIDKNSPIEIRIDGKATTRTLESLTDDDNATISYTPLDLEELKKYKPKNNTIKIKAILRCPIKDLSAPTIESLNIKRFGADMLWQNDILSL